SGSPNRACPAGSKRRPRTPACTWAPCDDQSMLKADLSRFLRFCCHRDPKHSGHTCVTRMENDTMPHRLLSNHAHRLLLLAVLISVLAACATSAVPPKEEDDDWVNLCAGDPAVVITVPDQNLRESITIAVRRDTGGSEVLSCANLAQVKQLNITNKDLSSLEGVQYLVNATVLSFDNSPFPNSHASRLGGLTSVARLTLRNLPLDRLSFAAGMTALERVSIDSPAITSIEPLP